MACRVYQEDSSVRTTSRFQVLDVTSIVEEAVSKSGIEKGLATVYVPHTTCGITINEAEPGLMEDIVEFLKEYTKPGAPWRHNRIDDNAHAHLGQSVLGHHVSIPVTAGRLNMGTWQRVLLVEMDGPRRRRIIITVMGE
ncbi:MAG: secondary thiamine-phosphate synthase enzyme YjbQ [Desulfurococcales archaeon]|nr:secondary thiamine-phosphate synthase enzyme YjbQ [Desulfurococcales archaeon]